VEIIKPARPTAPTSRAPSPAATAPARVPSSEVAGSSMPPSSPPAGTAAQFFEAFYEQDYYNNNRLLRCSYAAIDDYSRKFMSVGLNPRKRLRPTVCLCHEAASLEIKDIAPMMSDLRGLKRRLVPTLG
ncbi:hypothetical protein CBL_21076, partial [Carabus blaptoides fortunei]